MSKSSLLHEPESKFDERNNFLYFVLGLISLSDSFLRTLDSELPAVDPLLNSGEDKKNSRTKPAADLRDLLI